MVNDAERERIELGNGVSLCSPEPNVWQLEGNGISMPILPFMAEALKALAAPTRPSAPLDEDVVLSLADIIAEHVRADEDQDGIKVNPTSIEDAAEAALKAGYAPRPSFQARVDDWLIACFGEEIARDKAERNHRFLEEALELVQACECTASEAHQLVDYVFGRPVGDRHQESGGVSNTHAALCLAHGIDMDAAAEAELARVWTKVEKIRAKQAAKPKHSPLPEHVTAPPRPSVPGEVEALLAAYAPHQKWKPIETAPKDRWIIVYAPGAEFDLSDIVCPALWHPDAGFCVDELRYATLWQALPAPPQTREPSPAVMEGGAPSPELKEQA